ncbi:MFS transporter [Azospirillum sp. SYSU D00513]|uniref:MFS transporter n=1 Tax=Azospirillum sp. SYSU D00513 TaxID=2812561 RepID=UPI001A95AA06|nr:MFS transporter [Azospirillum sp. SYSU D00513]
MRHGLGREAGFWVSAAVVAHTLWTSAAPAMIYPLYAAQWGLTPTVTTGLFAVYPIVVVAVLIGFGTLSDRIGRRAAMLLGLAASAGGVLLLAVAADVGTLFAGRILMGIGVGLSAGPAAAALVEFAGPGGTGRAGSVTAAAQSLGLALALLLGGALVQHAPWPARLSFWLLFAVLVLIFAAAWFLPHGRADSPPARWRPGTPSVPPHARGAFATAALAVTAAYTHGAILMSLGAQIADDLVASPDAFVNGAALSLFALASGAVGILARGMAPRAAMIGGGAVSVAGAAFLAGSAALQSLVFFLAATAMAGAGYALLVLGGLGIVNAAVPDRQRGGTLSALFLFAYLFTGVLTAGLGRVAAGAGLETAVDIGAAVMGLLGGLTVLRAAGNHAKPESPARAGACPG